MPGSFSLDVAAPVHVDMRVVRSVVAVLVGVNLGFESLLERPKPNSNEQNPHQTLTPRGDQIDRHQLTEEQRGQADQRHTNCVPDRPLHPDPQRLAWPVYCEWSNGRQMIGTSQNMDSPRKEPSERDDHMPTSASASLCGQTAHA
jgi:hypothetical protein